MKFIIKKANFEQVRKYVLESVSEQASLFDSFLEGHILKSDFYIIEVDGEVACTFGIRDSEMMSHFYIVEKYRRYGQRLFETARKSDHITFAYISTGDELFLSHALDRPKRIETQAYFYKLAESVYDPTSCVDGLELSLATSNDADMILSLSGDFFEDIPTQIENKEIYIGTIKDEVVSFGIVERSKLYKSVGSTGMFVVEKHRIGGIGRSTIIKLIQQLKNEGVIPIAGCWYYNHNSKKTLESAGYYTQTRLIKVHL